MRKDEYLLGYIWLVSRCNGRNTMKGLTLGVADRTALQPPWMVPSNLRGIAAALYPAAGTADELMAKHTLLPLLLPFSSRDMRPTILSHVLDGVTAKGVSSSLGLGSPGVQSKPVMALCTQCVEEDEEKLGVAYWRRIHQVPGLGICPEHRCRLVGGCGHCKFSRRTCREARLPEVNCWCGLPHQHIFEDIEDSEMKTLVDLAMIAKALLTDEYALCDGAMFGELYHRRAQAMGFAYGSSLRTQAIMQAVRNRYSERTLKRLNAALAGKSNWLTLAFGSKKAPLILGRNLILLHFLGGLPSREEMDLCNQGEPALRNHEVVRVRATNPQWIEAACAAIAKYREENPDATREVILRALGRTAMDLRAGDVERYRAVMPASQTGLKLNKVTSRIDAPTMDARAAAWIKSRQKQELSTTTRPVPMTRRFLLEGLPNANAMTSDELLRMPQTLAALEACIEPREKFQFRFAKWLIEEKDASLRSQDMTRISRRTGLTLPEVDDAHGEVVAERLRKVM